MDFDTVLGFGQCVVNELCKVDLGKLIKRGKKRLGVVFNLDKHTQSGSHWVAMFLNYDIGDIYYWDSYASEPTGEVIELMNRLKEQGSKLGKPMTIKINEIRHQYKNSECGVYCIYFITSLLDGRKFEDVTRRIVADDEMNAKRREFFANV
jgi:Ulp1 family protease